MTAASEWSYVFEDKEAYDEDGVAITYTIEEEAVAGYETSINGFDVTNLRVGSILISGTKRWVGDKSSDRPEAIVIELYRDGKKIEEQRVTKENDWTYSFGTLPQFDENGKEYLYTIKEQEVEGYDSKVEGFDVTNTLIETPVLSKDPEEPQKGNRLPVTATNIFNLIAAGVGLIGTAGAGLFFSKSKKSKEE